MSKIPAKILVIDDDPDVLTAARVVLRQAFDTVVTEQNISKLESLLRQNKFDVILLDMNFAAGVNSGNEGLYWLKQILRGQPAQKIILFTAYSDIQLAIEGMKAGAADFIVKPWDNEKLVSLVGAAIGTGRERARSESRETSPPAIIGTSDKWKRVIDTIARVSTTDASVMLLGESGTGKGMLARLIHELSPRRSEPFVSIDLGSLTETLFESELFGHRKGAFTDAREDRVGKFSLADRGTLFLDEIGNTSATQQAKLLSVLQTGRFSAVGSNETASTDIRLITATNRNIHDAVRANSFREDLLFRINTIEIQVPPLRERREDIPLLANYYLDHFCEKYHRPRKTLSADAVDKLLQHPWPGNVRELSHAMERAVIMQDEPTLNRNDFVLVARSITHPVEGLPLDDLERNAIIQSIARHEGNMSRVARELGLGRTTLYRKMEKYGIQKSAS